MLVAVLAVWSCNSDPDSKLKGALEEAVQEKAGGFGKMQDYKLISYEVDTVRVSDIKAFEEKCFPKSDYPQGVPSDFSDEQFDEFVKPLKDHKSDNDIVYLSVKHKYSIYNPIVKQTVTVKSYELLNPSTLEYIGSDLRKGHDWSGADDYQMKKLDAEIDSLEKVYNSIQ